MMLDILEDVLCPGLRYEWYEDMVASVGFHRHNVRIFEIPTKRYESVNCVRQLLVVAHTLPSLCDNLYNVCKECKHEARCTIQNAKRTVLLEEAEKDARRNPSSNYPVSPNSRSVKILRLKTENRVQQQQHQFDALLKSTSKLY